MDVGRLESVLGRSRVPQSTPGRSKIEAKTVQNGLEMESRIPNRVLGSAPECVGLIFSDFGPSWASGPKIEKKSIPKSIKILMLFKIDFGTDFGIQHGPKNLPKSYPKPLKNHSKFNAVCDRVFDMIFYRIVSVLAAARPTI